MHAHIVAFRARPSRPRFYMALDNRPWHPARPGLSRQQVGAEPFPAHVAPTRQQPTGAGLPSNPCCAVDSAPDDRVLFRSALDDQYCIDYWPARSAVQRCIHWVNWLEMGRVRGSDAKYESLWVHQHREGTASAPWYMDA